MLMYFSVTRTQSFLVYDIFVFMYGLFAVCWNGNNHSVNFKEPSSPFFCSFWKNLSILMLKKFSACGIWIILGVLHFYLPLCYHFGSWQAYIMSMVFHKLLTIENKSRFNLLTTISLFLDNWTVQLPSLRPFILNVFWSLILPVLSLISRPSLPFLIFWTNFM